MEMGQILGLRERYRILLETKELWEKNDGTVQGSVADKRFVEKKRIVGMNGKLW